MCVTRPPLAHLTSSLVATALAKRSHCLSPSLLQSPARVCQGHRQPAPHVIFLWQSPTLSSIPAAALPLHLHPSLRFLSCHAFLRVLIWPAPPPLPAPPLSSPSCSPCAPSHPPPPFRSSHSLYGGCACSVPGKPDLPRLLSTQAWAPCAQQNKHCPQTTHQLLHSFVKWTA
jgi:hypothetical protein